MDVLDLLRQKFLIESEPGPGPRMARTVLLTPEQEAAAQATVGRTVDAASLPRPETPELSVLDTLRARLDAEGAPLTQRETANLPAEVPTPGVGDMISGAKPKSPRELAQGNIQKQTDQGYLNTHGFPDVFAAQKASDEMGRQYLEAQKKFIGPTEPGTVSREIDQYPEAKAQIEGFLQAADPTRDIYKEEDLQRVMPLIRSGGAGILGAIAGLMGAAAKIANQTYNYGAPGTMDPASEGAIRNMMASSERLWYASGLPTDPNDTERFVGELAKGMGGAAVDLPIIMSLGPYGLAAMGAVHGLADGGPKGMLTGAVEGYLTGKIMHGLNQIPSRVVATGANAALFGGMAAGEGANTEETIKQSIIGGALSLIGGRSPAQAERRARILNDREAARIIQKVAPDIDIKDLDEFGGPAKALEMAASLTAKEMAQKSEARPSVEPSASPETPPTPEQLQASVLPVSQGVVNTNPDELQQNLNRFPRAPKSNVQYTKAEDLAPVDVITRNLERIGEVPKGQGDAAIAKLKAQFPDEDFGVSNIETLSNVNTPHDEMVANVQGKMAAEASKSKSSSFFQKADKGEADPYADSEIFGQAKPATSEPPYVPPGAEPPAKPGDLKYIYAGPALNSPELKPVIDRLKTALIDKFYPIHDLVKNLADKGINPDILHNPSILVRLLGGVGGRAEAKVFYKRFTTDNDGKITFSGDSLEDIVKPIVDGKRLGQFNDFLVYRRALEVAKNSKGEIKTGVDLERAQQFVDEHGAEFNDPAKRFTGFFHAMLDELQDSGLMSPEVVADLKEKNPNYAPLRRVLDEMENHGIRSSIKETLDKVASPIKKMRGSELDVLPPTESAVLMTYEITSAVERNRVAQAIIDLRGLPGAGLDDVIYRVKPKIRMVRDLSTGEDVPTISDRQEPDVVAVSFDGHRQYWRVPRDIADSMKMIHESGLGTFVKLLAIPARMLRTGATSAPEFAFRNPVRDTLTAFMNSKKGFNPLIDFPKGFFEMIAKPEEYWRWKASGGEWSMLVTLDRAFGSDAIKKMETVEKSLKRFVKTPLGYLEALSEAGEKPTRLGVFSRSRAKGMTDLEAAIQSREASTDFHIRGADTKSASALYTFLNARLQTTVKLTRSAVENPAKFAIKGFAAASIPSMLLYAINRDDPDYWKRSELERDTFWFLPLYIGGRQVKVPKGEVGVLFGTGAEKVLQYLDKKAEYRPRVTQFLNDVAQQFSPIGNWGETLPTAVRPIMEWVTNRSFYYGTPLVQDTQEKKAAYLQYKPQTSETMKELGKAAQNVPGLQKSGGLSPAKMENTLRGYTGGVGRHTLRAVDWIAGKLGVEKAGSRPSDAINIPGLAGFVSQRAQGFEGEPARKFYEMADALDTYKATIRDLAQGGKSKEIETWINNHPTETTLLSLADHWTQARTELAELRKAQNLIVASKELSGQQKSEAMRILDKKVSEIVDPLWKLTNLINSPPRK